MQGTAGSPTSAQQPWWWIFDPRCSLRARAALMVGVGMVTLTLLLAWSTGTIFRRALEIHPHLDGVRHNLALAQAEGGGSGYLQ